MNKGQSVPGPSAPPLRFPPCLPGRKLRRSLAGNPPEPGNSEGPDGREKLGLERPQNEGRLAPAEDENASSACFSPRPALLPLSTEGMLPQNKTRRETKMETKGLTCKIPLELHSRITDEIQRTESTLGKFIEKIILEHYERRRDNG